MIQCAFTEEMIIMQKWSFFCLSLFRTQGSSVADGEDQEDFPGELTLHSDPLTPEELPSTPANAVEAHRDLQPGEENRLLGMHEACSNQICVGGFIGLKKKKSTLRAI